MSYPLFNHRRHHPHPHPQPEPSPEPQPAPPPAPVPSSGGDVPWPSFQGIATLAGTSASDVSVYYDDSLGQQGLDAANALLAEIDQAVALNTEIFGAHPSGPVNVIVFALNGAIDGTGGADHMACDFVNGGNIEVDISEGDAARMVSLFEAELSECSMNGRLCGLSTGEALSRWCAMVTANNALSDFETVSAWVQAGKPDWITQTNPTDQDPVSTGCGMAFISWLISQGHDLPTIAQEMVYNGDSGTFAMLSPDTSVYNTFLEAFNAITDPSRVNSDDPFDAFKEALPASV